MRRAAACVGFAQFGGQRPLLACRHRQTQGPGVGAEAEPFDPLHSPRMEACRKPADAGCGGGVACQKAAAAHPRRSDIPTPGHQVAVARCGSRKSAQPGAADQPLSRLQTDGGVGVEDYFARRWPPFPGAGVAPCPEACRSDETIAPAHRLLFRLQGVFGRLRAGNGRRGTVKFRRKPSRQKQGGGEVNFRNGPAKQQRRRRAAAEQPDAQRPRGKCEAFGQYDSRREGEQRTEHGHPP
ncbi:MAG TPA: hypothetical protein OIL94_08475 [Rikenellaceae bacterium]|nr:hypothetical protein [Rikenellaceae bacterium]